MFSIYKRTNLINGKIYIGQTKRDIKIRWAEEDIGNQEIGKAVREFGKENFINEIIEYPKSIDEMNEREKYWIEYYDSSNPNKGYNKTKGGGGYDNDNTKYILLNDKILFNSLYDLSSYFKISINNLSSFLSRNKDKILNWEKIRYKNYKDGLEDMLLVRWIDFKEVRNHFKYLLDDNEIIIYEQK